MKQFIVYVGLLVGLVISVQAEPSDAWPTNFTHAITAAKGADRPLLLYFTASWCGPCRLMKRTTLADTNINQLLTSFEKVTLDFDQSPELAKQFGIQGIPAFVVLSSWGDIKGKNIGYLDVPQFERFLSDGLAAAAFAAGQQKVFAENVAELEKQLNSADAQSKRKAVEQVFEMCGSFERLDRDYGSRKIKELGAADPALLLDGLNHKRLSVRIEVAKLLQQKYGDKFAFDPWLTEPERTAAAAKAKTDLSGK